MNFEKNYGPFVHKIDKKNKEITGIPELWNDYLVSLLGYSDTPCEI